MLVSRGLASVQLDLWLHKQGARLEPYLHYGTVIRMLGFIHRSSDYK